MMVDKLLCKFKSDSEIHKHSSGFSYNAFLCDLLVTVSLVIRKIKWCR